MKRLFKVGLVVGLAAAVMKVVAAKKADWTNLTESELRAKLESKLASKVPEDKRTEITEKVVGALRERGMVREEPGEA